MLRRLWRKIFAGMRALHLAVGCFAATDSNSTVVLARIACAADADYIATDGEAQVCLHVRLCSSRSLVVQKWDKPRSV